MLHNQQGDTPEMFDAAVEVLAAAVAADSSAQVLQNVHREQVRLWREALTFLYDLTNNCSDLMSPEGTMLLSWCCSGLLWHAGALSWC